MNKDSWLPVVPDSEARKRCVGQRVAGNRARFCVPGSPEALRVSDGEWLVHEARHPHQVVRGRYQVAGQLSARQAAVARTSEAPHLLKPAEDFLDSFSG